MYFFEYDKNILFMGIEDIDFEFITSEADRKKLQDCCEKSKKSKDKSLSKNDNKDRETCYKCGGKTDILMGDMGSVWHYCKICKL